MFTLLIIMFVLLIGIIVLLSIMTGLMINSNETEGIPPVIFLICLSLFGLVQLTSKLSFENHKKIIYEKPEINYFKKYDDKVIIILDGDVSIIKKEIKWSNTNNIFRKKEFYKDKTNISYVVKEN